MKLGDRIGTGRDGYRAMKVGTLVRIADFKWVGLGTAWLELNNWHGPGIGASGQLLATENWSQPDATLIEKGDYYISMRETRRAVKFEWDDPLVPDEVHTNRALLAMGLLEKRSA